MAAASAALAAPLLPTAPSTDAVIHDIADDNEDDHIRFKFGGDQRDLLASFESLPGDADRYQARAAEEEARNHAISMSRAYQCSDLDSVARRGPEPAQVEQENRELADAIAATDEAVAVAARDRARYHADMAAVEAAVKRVHWDSSLAEALESCRR
jgi:dihydroorotase-like cyclic amidohydrolase